MLCEDNKGEPLKITADRLGVDKINIQHWETHESVKGSECSFVSEFPLHFRELKMENTGKASILLTVHLKPFK